MLQLGYSMVVGIVVGVFAFGGAYAGMKGEIRHLWREVNRVDNSVTHAHERIDNL